MKRGTRFASIMSGLVVAGAVCGPSTAAAEEAPGAATPVAPAPAATAAPQGMVDAPLPAAASGPAPAHLREGGFVLELSTGGLSGGALGIGGGIRSMAVGVGVDYWYTSLASEEGSAYGMKHTQSTLAIGPWLRVELLRTQDDRVALFGALDIQYGRQLRSSENERASADGIILRLGPGIRYWATRWLALGYSSQLVVSSLTGPLFAFTGQSSTSFGRVEVGLAGRFTVLAIF